MSARERAEAWLMEELKRADVDTEAYLPYIMDFLEDGGACDVEGAAETLSAVMDVCSFDLWLQMLAACTLATST